MTKENISMNSLKREFDAHGLKLAIYQARIFERSITDIDSSSLVFLRRYMNSEVAFKADKASFNTSLDEFEAIRLIKEEYPSNYGHDKFQKDEMFWMGYIYRYISYTRMCSTKKAFSLVKPEKLRRLYYVYHTQSEEWVVKSLLELKKEDDSFFFPVDKIKEALKKRYRNIL